MRLRGWKMPAQSEVVFSSTAKLTNKRPGEFRRWPSDRYEHREHGETALPAVPVAKLDEFDRAGRHDRWLVLIFSAVHAGCGVALLQSVPRHPYLYHRAGFSVLRTFSGGGGGAARTAQTRRGRRAFAGGAG